MYTDSPCLLDTLFPQVHSPFFPTLLVMALARFPQPLASNGFDPWETALVFLEAALLQSHKPNGLKQEKFIVSRFWRLEAQNQNSRFPLKPVGKNPCLLHLLSGVCHQSLNIDQFHLCPVITWLSSPPACLCVFLFL